MSDRPSIPPKLRFEVFKRDKFTCQYCGSRAPDVVLHADHVVPVAGGGTTDVVNLITSCSRCNYGKGAVPLTDSAAVDRQLDVLGDLEERRQQIEWMVRWRDELQSLGQDTVETIASRISERGGFAPNESGKADIKRWLKRFDVAELLHAVDEAFDTYLQYLNDQPTLESWGRAFAKIPGAAGVVRQEVERPYVRQLLYIQGIIRKRSRARRYNCFDYLEHLHLCGADLDEMERRAKRIASISDFEEPYDAWLEQIGRPF